MFSDLFNLDPPHLREAIGLWGVLWRLVLGTITATATCYFCDPQSYRRWAPGAIGLAFIYVFVVFGFFRAVVPADGGWNTLVNWALMGGVPALILWLSRGRWWLGAVALFLATVVAKLADIFFEHAISVSALGLS